MILVLNPGSSSLKFAAFDRADSPPSVEGTVERLGTAEARLKWDRGGKDEEPESLPDISLADAVEKVRSLLPAPPAKIGCRVVMGGAQFVEPTRVTLDVIAEIRRLGELAPLHNPPAADTLESCLANLPEVPAWAVFDTAFHATLPDIARTYALPHGLAEKNGLHRYGFHGIAHRWVSERLRERLTTEGKPGTRGTWVGRIVTCHLGSGASACAIRDGKSVDTSMGLTPMEGLMMGTRAGDVDPGLLLHLQTALGMSADGVDDLLNKKSGLLGVSGVSADLRDVEKAVAAGNPHAILAVELFAYRVAKTIGAYAVALEGLDAVGFSGGIGENAALMRERICRRLAFLGLTLDSARNAAGLPDEDTPARISVDNATVAAWIIPADEARQIAREIADL